MYKKSCQLIFIYYNILHLGGMSLKTIRILQWLIGILLLVYGIYLIFGTQEFFGTILIIGAFLIFPTVKRKAHSNDYNDNNDVSKDDNTYAGGDSDGGGGDSGGD